MNLIDIVRLRRKNVYVSVLCRYDYAVFGGSNSVKRNSNVNNSFIGFGTYIGQHCRIENCNIGNYTSIANNVIVVSNDHPISNNIATHPAFHRPNHKLMKKLSLSNLDVPTFQEDKTVDGKNRVDIGSDVWVGEGVKILPGIKIGTGAVIATGAVVTKHVPPYSIVAGVPAKIIKFRFDPDIIETLINSQWWEIQDSSIYDVVNDLNSRLIL